MTTYSHSRLQTFEQCRLKFKYQYIDKIKKPEEETVEAFVGSRVHDTFQKLYDDLLLERANSLEELQAHFRELWNRNWTPEVKIVREGMTPDNYREYGEKCIRNYYEIYHPFDQRQTIKTEAHIVFPLDGSGGHEFQGYIDRLARRPDGTWEIHDYKTSRSLPTQADVDKDRQLAIYQIGLPSQWEGVENVDLIWHYVALDTTLRSTRTADQLEKLRTQTVGLIDEIESTTDFPPQKGNLCNWCEFKPDCPLFRHEVQVTGPEGREFTEDDGVRLATSYAEKKAQVKTLETELDELHDQIVEFARQKKVLMIRGKGVRVSVSFRISTKFPRAHAPRRVELEAIVKDSGNWEEVAQLNTRELAKVIEERRWPEKLVKKLSEFASREESVTLRVSRIKEEDMEQ